jgi:hypothetical protein
MSTKIRMISLYEKSLRNAPKAAHEGVEGA